MRFFGWKNNFEVSYAFHLQTKLVDIFTETLSNWRNIHQRKIHNKYLKAIMVASTPQNHILVLKKRYEKLAYTLLLVLLYLVQNLFNWSMGESGQLRKKFSPIYLPSEHCFDFYFATLIPFQHLRLIPKEYKVDSREWRGVP